jgi:DNA invertase Pin-like site-specific DNA recombinase
MQSKASCADQERQVRECLARLGIDHRNFLVLADEAISGTKTDRPNFQRLLEMIKRGEVNVLAVDEQSRLTRGFDATKIIQDLQYSGGRFVSTSEGLDSNVSSWKMLAGFKQIANNAVIDETAGRVRRGQKGNLTQNQSAGDNPFGYEPYYLDPDAALRIGNGPKPKKGVRIKDADARIVQEIFRRFISGESMTAIARDLTLRKIPRGNRVKDTRWSHAQVRRILENSKYVGEWIWGRTKTMRNGSGKIRQAKTPREDWLKVDRPHLRIVDQGTWEATQAKLKSIHQRYGYKEGQRKRGPAIHHSVDYPTGLLNGLLHCKCGARMRIHSKARIGENEPEKYFVCPIEHKDKGACTMASHVPADKAEQAVTETILGRLTSHHNWQSIVLDEMRAKIQANASAAGSTVASLQQRKKETQRKLDNLVEALTEGTLTGPSVKSRLAELESELESINSIMVLPFGSLVVTFAKLILQTSCSCSCRIRKVSIRSSCGSSPGSSPSCTLQFPLMRSVRDAIFLFMSALRMSASACFMIRLRARVGKQRFEFGTSRHYELRFGLTLEREIFGKPRPANDEEPRITFNFH